MVIMILNSEGESGGRGSFDPWQIVQHNIRDEPHKVIVNGVNDHDSCNTDNDPLYI